MSPAATIRLLEILKLEAEDGQAMLEVMRPETAVSRQHPEIEVLYLRA